MDVSWEPVEQGEVTGVLLGYEIRYWKDGDKEEAADRVRTAGLVTSAHVTGLNPNTVYHVSVRAYNRAGTGPPSPSTNVTTTRPPPKRPPGNISWSFSGSTVSIKWDPVVAKADESAVTGYKLCGASKFPKFRAEFPQIPVPSTPRSSISTKHTKNPHKTPNSPQRPLHPIPVPRFFPGTSMMVEDSGTRPAPHIMVVTTNSLLMVALISSLEL
ncbi:CNTN2 protein, partial [Leiothrix lutea]|nr:CNTN2 protein [Leiothrix lutea]